MLYAAYALSSELLVDTVIACLPASKARLATYINSQKADHTLIQVRQYSQDGWPSKHEIDPAVKPYWESRGSLTVGNDILLFNGRIVVPQALQQDTINKIHEGHQGIERCSKFMCMVAGIINTYYPESMKLLHLLSRFCA